MFVLKWTRLVFYEVNKTEKILGVSIIHLLKNLKSLNTTFEKIFTKIRCFFK